MVDARSLAGWAVHLGTDAAAVDPARLRAELSDGTLPEAFANAAARAPDAPALRIGDQLTHGQLDEGAGRMAAALAEDGVRPGDRVVLSAPTSDALVLAYLGVLRRGAVAVPINAAYTPPELEHAVRAADASLVLTAGPMTGLRARTLTVGELKARASGLASHAPAARRSDDVAVLSFTSGTTGRPKGVPLSHGNLLSSIRGVLRAWRWNVEDVLVHTLPLSHQHGLGGLHATLLAGSRAQILPTFDPDRLLEVLREEHATVLFAVPAMYSRLAALDPERLSVLRTLRLMTSGSAPLSPALGQQIATAAGCVPLERYGLTETGLDLSNPLDGLRRLGTVGVPLPGVEVRIADESGSPVPDGDDGEILLRGPQVIKAYWHDEGATASAFWADGWFRTGDLGHWNDEQGGHVVISGRLKELIITGGMNVSPREVELVLESHPDVAAAAVAGMPSETWGEQVEAWIVPRGAAADPDELLEHCRARLVAYKRPKQVHVVPTLPRNAMGKVLRAELRRPDTGTHG